MVSYTNGWVMCFIIVAVGFVIYWREECWGKEQEVEEGYS